MDHACMLTSGMLLHGKRAAPVYKSNLAKHRQDLSCLPVLDRQGLAGFFAPVLV